MKAARKLKIFILLFALMVVCGQTVASAEDKEAPAMTVNNKTIENVIQTDIIYHSGRYDYRLDGNRNAIIVRYHEGEEQDISLDIPDQLDNHIVTEIGNEAFAGCSTLKKVTIPGTVITLDDDCFYGCRYMTDIIIPESVTSIGYTVFGGCSALRAVVLPEHLKELGSGAFWDCFSLTQLYIPGEIKRMGMEVCAGSRIYDVYYGGTREDWDRYGVDWRPSHDVGLFGGGYIRRNIHYNTDPGDIVFQEIETYRSGEFLYTLNDCGEAIIVTYIPEDPEKTLDLLIIPSSLDGHPVIGIGEGAFCGANVLSVILPAGITFLSRDAFMNCDRLENIALSTGLKCIGDHAFAGCVALESISLPASLTDLGEAPFPFGWNNCLKVMLPPDNTSFEMRDGMLIDRQAKRLIYTLTEEESFDLPEDLQIIGDFAFAYREMQQIVIPDNVRVIGSGAFMECENLTGISIPASVTEIGDQAFYRCSSLENIELPPSMTRIGDSAFESCKVLKSIAVPLGVKEIGYSTFYGCHSLTNITLPSSVTYIGDEAFMESLITAIKLPENLTHIGDWSFSDCALTNIELPPSMKSIGYSAFTGSSLKNIRIPSCITRIGKDAFYGADSLHDIYYEGTEEKWKRVFQGDEKSLEGITIHYISSW